MLSSDGIELIESKLIGALGDFQVSKRNISRNGALSPAHGTITATRIIYSVWQMHNKLNLPTMATAFMVRLNLGISYFSDHCIAGTCLMFNYLEHDNAITNVHKVQVTPRLDL